MMQPRFLIVAALSLVVSAAAAAAELAPTVRVPVDSQQSETREQAVTEAIAEILLRLTGRDDIADAEAVEPLLADPGRFLQRYQYESAADDGLILSMQFNGTALRRALAEQGVATWGEDRPPVLVWLAVEQSGRRLLVGGEEGGSVRTELQQAADRRGVLLLFPLLDSEDRRRIRYTDVFGGFTERVHQASERYGTPLVAMGRMHREGGIWKTRWRLSGAQQASWSSSGSTAEAALDAAAAELGAKLAKHYASLPSAQSAQQLEVRIVGIDSLRDYARLERRLRDIGGIADIRPLTLEPDAVVVRLTLRTEPGRVLQALRRDRLLLPLEALDQAVDQPPPAFQTPIFRLTP